MPYREPRRCPGCRQRALPAGKLACPPCWSKVDRPTQQAVYATWAGGQGAFTDEYRAARDAALAQMRPRSTR